MKVFACALAIACAAPAANATVITFNDLAGTAVPGSTDVSFYGYTEFENSAAIVDGFSFKASANWGYLEGPDDTGPNAASSHPYNGNDFYMAGNGLTMQSVNPANFSVSSLDLGSWWYGGTMSVTLTGTRADGSTVTQNVSATIVNATSADDFTHVTLDGFTNIKSLQFGGTIPGHYLAVDNIVVDVTAVPEPGSLALLGLGLAAVAGLRRRKG